MAVSKKERNLPAKRTLPANRTLCSSASGLLSSSEPCASRISPSKRSQCNSIRDMREERRTKTNIKWDGTIHINTYIQSCTQKHFIYTETHMNIPYKHTYIYTNTPWYSHAYTSANTTGQKYNIPKRKNKTVVDKTYTLTRSYQQQKQQRQT